MVNEFGGVVRNGSVITNFITCILNTVLTFNFTLAIITETRNHAWGGGGAKQ